MVQPTLHNNKQQNQEQRHNVLVSDFVSLNTTRISEYVVHEMEGLLNRRDDLSKIKQFVNGVILAMTADDLNPLNNFFDLTTITEDSTSTTQINRLFTYLEGFSKAVNSIIEEDRKDPEARFALLLAVYEELGFLQHNLLLPYITNLQEHIVKMHNTSQASSTSLSITLHELRRPLTILSSYSQLLSTGMLGALPDPITVAIEGITSSTDTMIQLVNTLAEVSRLEDPEDKLVLEEAGLGETIALAVDTIAVDARLRDTSVLTELHDPQMTIKVDKRRFVMAVTNILSNALKHTPPGTDIQLTSSVDPEFIHLVIKDHGPGFPPEDSIHIFEKYYRSSNNTQRKVPGTGLGLFIVKTVIERHHGKVTARSEPDDGAEFEIMLPITGSE